MGQRKSLLHRLTASASRLDADELQEHAAQLSCARVDEVQHGSTVQVAGRLRSVRYLPNEHVPTLEAELYDGSETIELVWLGRRRISGIEPGRRLVARGRVGNFNGRKAMYNPWYQLLPSA